MTLKKKIIITSFLLGFVILAYLAIPYTKELRSQYSSIFESRGDELTKDSTPAALSQYSKANLIRSTDSLNLKIGEIYLNNNQILIAERHFDKIASSVEKSKVSDLYLKKGAVDKALTYLDKNLANDDILYMSNIISLLNNGELADCLRKTKCQTLVDKINKVKKNKSEEYRNIALAELLSKEDYQLLAIKKLEAIKYNEYRDYWLLLGKLYLKEDLYKKAAIALNKAIAIDPHYIEAYKLAILAEENSKDNQKAELLRTKLKSLSTDYLKY